METPGFFLLSRDRVDGSTPCTPFSFSSLLFSSFLFFSFLFFFFFFSLSPPHSLFLVAAFGSSLYGAGEVDLVGTAAFYEQFFGGDKFQKGAQGFSTLRTMGQYSTATVFFAPGENGYRYRILFG